LSGNMSNNDSMSCLPLLCKINKYKFCANLDRLSNVQHTLHEFTHFVTLSGSTCVCVCVCVCVHQIFTFRHITSPGVCNLQFTKTVLVEVSNILCGSLPQECIKGLQREYLILAHFTNIIRRGTMPLPIATRTVRCPE